MFRRRPTDRLEQLACPNVVVHLRSKQSLAGVLTGTYDKSISLRAARLFVEGSGAHAIDGEIIVPRDNISFVQLDVKVDDSNQRLSS